MALKFDHAVIAVEDLDGAMADYRALGFTVFRGGVHANRATENALIVFEDGTYLELLAGTRETPIAGLVDFSVLLKNGEGLVGYALGCDDIEAEVTRLRAAGFAMGEIIPGERRRSDSTLIQWKLALIEDGFAPFLIEDVTPRELRVTRDPTLTRHANRAVGVRGVEVAVRTMDEAWQRYTRLFGVPVNQRATTYRNAGCVTLRQGNPAKMNYFVNQLPDHRRMFAGSVAQNEVDEADPTQEPKGFERQREREAQKLLPLQREAEIERALAALTATQAEALFAIVLVREQAQDYRFALDKTHGVRFQERIGVSKERGRGILIGLDDFDWSSVTHAYGPATDVPDLLRALASDDKDVRRYAQELLGNGNIVHQGSVYPASIEVTSFLIQLVEAPQVEDKPYILELLSAIGAGPDEVKERAEKLLQDALPHYLALLHDPDPQIRLRVVELLRLYAKEINTVEPILKALIQNDEEPAVRGLCLMTLASLWLSGNESGKLSAEQVLYTANLMRDDTQPLGVQERAAEILMRADAQTWVDEALAMFYRMMQADDVTLGSIGHLGFLNMLLTVVQVLSAYPDKALEWLLTQAQHPNAEVRQSVPYVLGQLIGANQPVSMMIPVVVKLMYDPSPDVRQAAVGFFYHKPYAKDVVDVLRDVEAHDPSLTVRVVARNALGFIR